MRVIKFVAKSDRGRKPDLKRSGFFMSVRGQDHVNLPERIEAILFMAFSSACGSNGNIEGVS